MSYILINMPTVSLLNHLIDYGVFTYAVNAVAGLLRVLRVNSAGYSR